MAITFPGSPTLNDTHTVGNITWTWNGSSWTAAQAGSTYSDTDVATYLNTNLDTHIIPDQNDTYDLGSAELKFRDLYLGNTSIYLGTNTITGTADTLTWNGIGGISTSGGMSLTDLAKLPMLTAEPAAPEDGMIAFADGATWDPMAGPALPVIVARVAGQWFKIAGPTI